MNIFDKIVSFIDPQAGLRRMEARAMMDSSMRSSLPQDLIADDKQFIELKNQLDEARNANERLYNIAQYDPSLNPTAILVGSPDRDIISSIDVAKKLVRDRMMNDPQAIRLCEIYCDAVHGEGIQPYPDSKHEDMERKDRVDDMVSNIFEIHCESTDIDVNGVYDLFGLAWMAESEKATGGGALWIEVWNNKRDVLRKGIKHPLQLDVRSDRWLNKRMSSYQAKDANGVPTGAVYPVIGGIEFDPKDRSWRAAHIYTKDPLDGFDGDTESIRIPAKYFRYDAERKQLGQISGWPIMAPIVPGLQHLEDLTESSIKRAKIDTALSVILGVPMTYQNPDMNDGESDGFRYGSSSGDLPRDGSGLPVNAHGIPQSFIQPGMMGRVHKGTDVHVINPHPSSVYQSTYKNSERRLAMAVSQTYESVSGDYSGVNFISGRLAKGPVNRAMRRRQWNWIVQVGKPFWKSFITGCYTMNSWNIEGYPEYPSFDDIKPADVKWVYPVPDSADPLGEKRADQLAMRIGALDPIEMITRSGRDPDQVFRGYKKSYDKAAKYGLNLDRFIFSGDGTNLDASSGLINEASGMDENQVNGQ